MLPATLEAKAVACLDPENEAMETLTEMVSEEGLTFSDLQRITIPAAGTDEWTVVDENGSKERLAELTGIILKSQKSGVLWETEGIDGSGDPPLLTSHDLVTARNERGVEFPPHMIDDIEASRIGEDSKGPIYSWEALSYAQFGSSSKPGGGKRVSESRVVFLLPPDSVLPIIVSISSGSIKPWKQYLLRSQMKMTRRIVSIGLSETTNAAGIEFNQIVPKTVNLLSREDAAAVAKLYEPLISSVTNSPSLHLTNEGSDTKQLESKVAEGKPAEEKAAKASKAKK